MTVRIVYTGTCEGKLLGHDIDGKKVWATETILFGIKDGRISEYWYNWNELGFWTQLGIVESPYPEK
ncbi:ester cyclase [Rhodohalobacter sp. SW132]|uniref:ester cyclase n=1 Tax=Rhodohalobacter sp. SW132 TaxID=2293433 RepID=UPI001314B695|nr:ester cyclase [Rhodohalobacter sp. SW132]